MKTNEQHRDEERQIYYVDVHGKQLLLQQGASAYDLEIYASKEEARQIETQFRRLDERDESSLNLMMRYNLTQGEIIGQNNDQYDEEMRVLFRLLHQYGTEETRKHIESMNIL